jgi:hypothetical protein
MTSRLSLPVFLMFFALKSIATDHVPRFLSWAPTPPMGWNSWDCFATTVTETQAKANADVMADKLKPYGWQYVVVDIQWYEPAATGYNYHQGATLTMDQWGRLLPAENRFPSAADDNGFKALARYVHKKGLKFGIHLLRGIPRQAVVADLPIKGTKYTARDIADTNSVCAWNTDMYGVDMSRPGAQEYYDSVYQLVASWGVDFVKVDDLSRPYHEAEIEAIRKAIDKTGRLIVFSTSPGATPLADATNIEQQANMWRISDDFWDQWPLLLEQFKRLDNWTPYHGPGHFPDADMLPLGAIRQIGNATPPYTRFTPDEQVTMMTLWSIARSPLIMGGDLTKLDDSTLSLMTNAEVIAVDQHSSNNHQLFDHDGFIAWIADAPHSQDEYLALFNTLDQTTNVSVKVTALGLGNAVRIRDLWKQSDVNGAITGQFAPTLPAHGAGLYRVSSGGTTGQNQ